MSCIYLSTPSIKLVRRSPFRAVTLYHQPPPILFFHLVSVAYGGRESMGFVSDQGNNHRVEVEEEHD
jgi:hypothetical protein